MYAEPNSNANLLMIMQTVGVPLVIALFGLVIWWLNRRNSSNLTLIIVPFIAIGFWISFSWIQGRVGFPPQQAMDILIPLLLVSLILEFGSHRIGLSRSWEVVIALVIFMGFITWMLYPILSRTGVVENTLTLSSIAIFYLVIQTSLSSPSNGRVSNAMGLYLAATGVPLFALDGTLKLAQISGALATGLGVLWLAGLSKNRNVLPVRYVTAMMVAALYVAAQQYADVDPYALLLVSLGILIVSQLRRWWSIPSIWGDNIRVQVLGLLPFVAALWLIWPEESLY